MLIFEMILALLLGATMLSMVARRIGVPYPTLLAVGGALVAFVPGVPHLPLPPELILALFVAPVLLDAAHDTSLRELKQNWLALASLVFVAIGITTAAVAVTARMLLPEMPWPAAIALGALLAPPDAVAALAVFRHVNPPHRIRSILEGESLLNDASALLIYKLAVAAAAAGSFSLTGAIPAFGLVVIGSAAVGWLLSWPIGWATDRIDDVPSSVIFQFVSTFGVWLLAEHFELSGVVTIVVFGITIARRPAIPAEIRIPSFAIWETVTFVLNVVAFSLIGLQIIPILRTPGLTDRADMLLGSVAILAVVIGVRLVWVLGYRLIHWVRLSLDAEERPSLAPTLKDGVVIGWSGMRGIVTIAAALALPAGFPNRDFIQVTAFVVVLGTLVLQGVTLRPLIAWLQLPSDDTVETEITVARKAALKAAMASLQGDRSPAAERLRLHYRESLSQAKDGNDPRESPDTVLRLEAVPASRHAIAELRNSGAIGDDAYRAVEEELDLIELSSRSAESGAVSGQPDEPSSSMTKA